MADIYQYEQLYEDLKNGKDVNPVSREEAFMMALIDILRNISESVDNTELA